MPKNTARLTILIDQPTKQKLEKVSEAADLTVSQILRKLIKDHLNSIDPSASAHSGQSAEEDSSPHSAK